MRGVWRVGATGGLLAGVVLVLHLAAIAEIAAAPTTDPGIRSSTWTPLSGVASLVLGRGALHGTLALGPVAVGLALLLAFASVAGTAGTWFVWACLGAEGPVGLGIGLGVPYGLLVAVVALGLAVNPVQEPNVVYQSLPPWAWWAGLGVYGGVLGGLAARRLGSAVA